MTALFIKVLILMIKMFKKREDTYMTELKDINIINKKPTQNGL